MSPDVLERARELLTEKQLEVVERAHTPTKNHPRGMPLRAIAVDLGLARSTVVDRYDAACLRLRNGGVLFAGDGTPYLEVTA